MELLRERNQATTIYFPLRQAGAADFAASGDWTPAAGDVQFSVDGAAFANINGSTPTYIGNGTWKIDLIASEVNGKTTVVTVIDSATKAVDDQEILIRTYGDDSAGISWNQVADYVIRRTFQNACDSTRGDTKTGRSLLGAIAKLVNKVAASGATLTVYEDDDSTSLFTQAITTDSGADPITTLDTS